MKPKIFPRNLKTHARRDCLGQHCVIHSPSGHHMANWNINIRLDKHALAERLCPHGVGHPDPDSLAFYERVWLDKMFAQYALGLHGCDGCCIP